MYTVVKLDTLGKEFNPNLRVKYCSDSVSKSNTLLFDSSPPERKRRGLESQVFWRLASDDLGFSIVPNIPKQGKTGHNESTTRLLLNKQAIYNYFLPSTCISRHSAAGKSRDMKTPIKKLGLADLNILSGGGGGSPTTVW